MITESNDRLNIKELIIDEPPAEKALRLRRSIYEYCSSNKMAEMLIDHWRGFSHGKNRIIDGALILMLFPDRRESFDLTRNDQRIITHPSVKFDPARGWIEPDQIDFINLFAAGRILFPEESKGWYLDVEKSKEELERQMLQFTLHPRKQSYQHLSAVSEKILHEDLFPGNKGSYKYGVQLLEYLGEHNDMKSDGFVTLDLQTIPGLINILYPEKFSEFTPRANDLQNLLDRLPPHKTFDNQAFTVLLAKATVAESVTIDAKGAHFTSPKDDLLIDNSAMPNVRKF
jgi:hypothetical protein